MPIYQDAVLSVSLVRTLRAQFVQLRRWAWGASDVAYVIDKGWCTPNTVPRRDLAAKLARLLVGHVLWATAPLLFIAAQVLAVVLPIERAAPPADACGGWRAQGGGARRARPRHRREHPPAPAPTLLDIPAGGGRAMVLQWTLLPVTGLAYSAASALTSQSRLVAGRYLEQFDVTEKAVVTESGARVVDERTSPRHPPTAATGAGAALAGSPGRGGEGDGAAA